MLAVLLLVVCKDVSYYPRLINDTGDDEIL